MPIDHFFRQAERGARSRRSRACQRPRPALSTGGEKLERRDCPAGFFSIEPPSSPTIEGDTATFTVRLSEPSARPERVVVSTVGETALLGRDFMFQNNLQLVFAPGVTERQFSIGTRTDQLREGLETVRVVVNPTSRPAAPPISARLTIYDLVPTTASVSSIRVVEGNEGSSNAEFTVRITPGAILPVTIGYSTQDVTATAGVDYTAVSGMLTFAPGETVKKVTVPIAGERVAETDETFKLILANPSRGTTIPTPEAICTIVNDESDAIGFQITLDYVTTVFGEVPGSVRNAARVASQRWERVITGDLPAFTEISTGLFVDDFRMRVQMGLLGGAGTDGSGQALANARPVQYRAGPNGLPWLGETGIDPADVASPSLVGILIHEIGHALGFAPGLPAFDRWVVNNGWTGANAVREYNSLFNVSASAVPMESQGGPGTAGSHWSETVFRNELMTGFVDPDMRLSRITVGAFADLGYTVNYAAADPYSRPVTSIVATPTAGAMRLAATLGLPSQTMAAAAPARAGSVQRAAAPPQTVVQAVGVAPLVQEEAPKSIGQFRAPFRAASGVTLVDTKVFAAIGAASGLG